MKTKLQGLFVILPYLYGSEFDEGCEDGHKRVLLKKQQLMHLSPIQDLYSL